MAGKYYIKNISEDLKGKAQNQYSFEKYNKRMAKANIHYKMIVLERQRREKNEKVQEI
jgi:hypothetical protein